MSSNGYPRLLSFALENSTVLSGRVKVTLTDGVAVLVGRNGSGKSAILEGFDAISSRAVGKPSNILRGSDSIPQTLDIEVLTPANRRLKYWYQLVSLPASTDDLGADDVIDDTSKKGVPSWNDCCQYIDGHEEIIWSTDAGVTTLNRESDQTITILGETNALRLLHHQAGAQLKLPTEMQWIYSVLRRIRLLGKAPVRRFPSRRPSRLKESQGTFSIGSELADRLSWKVVLGMREQKVKELERICQRIGLAREITIEKFLPQEDKNNGKSIYSVLLDGVDVGLLSDGTLRVLSILIDLVNSNPSTTTIIEEPEAQIHPGMLSKLLNEIEAYTAGENLILSTHSPQVVSWTKPDKIQLVFRDNGRTFVRKLNEHEMQNVIAYLCEEGDLGEWIYSGILDE